jgi:hypothetical protein
LNEGHLTKLWSWFSIAAVLFLVTTVVTLQGGTEFVGRLFGEKAGPPVENPAGVAYFGVIVGGSLFFLASVPFLLHARRHGKAWHSKIPVVWLGELNTSAWEGKLFQFCVFLVLVVAPVVGIVSCLRIAERGDICEQDRKNFYAGADTNLFWAPVARDDQQMRLRKAGSGDAECKSGVEIFPRTWTPLFFYVVPLAGLALTLWGTLLVLFSRAEKKDDAPPAAEDT